MIQYANLLPIKTGSNFIFLLIRTRTDINEINKEIIKIKIINQELEAKTVMHDGDLSELKTDSEATKMNMQLMQRRLGEIPMRVSDIEDQIEQMKTQLASSMSNNQL